MVELAFPDPVARPHLRVCLDGVPVAPGEWHVEPPDGATVELAFLPGDSNALRLGLTLAVAAAAIGATVALGPGGLATAGLLSSGWASVLGATISGVGMFAVTSLVPPELPETTKQQKAGSPSYSLQGGQNTDRYGQPVAVMIGEHRVVCTLAAPWYTEIVDNIVFLRGLLDVAKGEYEVSAPRIDKQPFEYFNDIDWEVLPGTSTQPETSQLYPGNVVPSGEAQGRNLTQKDGEITLTTADDTESWEADIGAARGLIGYGHNTGDVLGADVDFEVRWRTAADDDGNPAGPWSNPETRRVHGRDATPQLRTLAGDFPSRSRWDWAIKRVTDDTDATGTTSGLPKRLDATSLEGFRSINRDPPYSEPGVVRLAMRIKSTGQLNGTIGTVSVLARLITPEWDRNARAWIKRPTRGCEAAFRFILQGKAQLLPIGDDLLDLPGLEAWAEWCQDNDYTCDFVFEQEIGLEDALKIPAACGRASLWNPDGVYGVAVDGPKPVRAGVLTPRNCYAIRYRIEYPTVPDALRVKFADRTQDYRADATRVVYRPGYGNARMLLTDPSLRLAGNNIADWEMPGVTDPELIHRGGLKRFAELDLRRERWEADVGWGGWAYTRGDRIGIAKQTIGVGFGAAKVADVELAAGRVVALLLDAPLTLDGSVRVGAVVRLRTGAAWAAEVQSWSGDNALLQLPSPVDPALDDDGVTVIGPLVGQDLALGPLGQELVDCLVMEITRGRGHRATIRATNLAPAIQTADKGPVPAWAPVFADAPGSRSPIIYRVESDETVLIRDADGSHRVAMVVAFVRGGVPLHQYDLIRLTFQDDQPGSHPHFAECPADAPFLRVSDVVEGRTYTMSAAYRIRREYGGGWGPQSPGGTHTIVGAHVSPPDVGKPYLGGDRVLWPYPNPPPNLAGFWVKTGDEPGLDWEAATWLSEAVYPQPFVLLAEIPDRAAEVLIVAVTTANERSLIPGRIAVAGVPRPDTVEVWREDLGAAGYPGEITDASGAPGGATAAGGGLTAASSSAWLAPAEGPWLSPPTSPWLENEYSGWTYVARVGMPAQARVDDALVVLLQTTGTVEGQFRWLDNSLTRFSEDDPVPGEDVIVPPEWVPVGALVSGLAEINPFGGWRDGVRPVIGGVLELRLTGKAGGGVAPSITLLAVTLAAAMKVQRFGDQTVQPGGSQLIMPAGYRAVAWVHVTPKQPTAAARFGIADKYAPGGPVVVGFDEQGYTVGYEGDCTVGWA